MAEKRYYWLKLKEDYFNSPKIKKLRKIAGGDTYTIIYLKMQLLSVSNKGIIIFEGIEKTLEEELALKLDEQLVDVQLTLTYLKSQGLLEQNENEFLLPEASNNIGSESDSAERVRLFRERKRQNSLQCNGDVTDLLHSSISISNSNSISNNINNKEPALYKLQLNDNSYFEVTQSFYDQLKPLYPAVDLDNEFRQMISWLIGNPNKRKTKSGIKRFITSWLSREQNKGGSKTYQKPAEFMKHDFAQEELNGLFDNDNMVLR